MSEMHAAKDIRTVDGWIQVVHCSCSEDSFPTTHEWASNHYAGSFEDGWKVLEDLFWQQKSNRSKP